MSSIVLLPRWYSQRFDNDVWIINTYRNSCIIFNIYVYKTITYYLRQYIPAFEGMMVEKKYKLLLQIRLVLLERVLRVLINDAFVWTYLGGCWSGKLKNKLRPLRSEYIILKNVLESKTCFSHGTRDSYTHAYAHTHTQIRTKNRIDNSCFHIALLAEVRASASLE